VFLKAEVESFRCRNTLNLTTFSKKKINKAMSSTLFLKGDTYLHHIPLFKFIKQLQSFNPASVADSLISCDIMERCAITKAGN